MDHDPSIGGNNPKTTNIKNDPHWKEEEEEKSKVASATAAVASSASSTSHSTQGSVESMHNSLSSGSTDEATDTAVPPANTTITLSEESNDMPTQDTSVAASVDLETPPNSTSPNSTHTNTEVEAETETQISELVSSVEARNIAQAEAETALGISSVNHGPLRSPVAGDNDDKPSSTFEASAAKTTTPADDARDIRAKAKTMAVQSFSGQTAPLSSKLVVDSDPSNTVETASTTENTMPAVNDSTVAPPGKAENVSVRSPHSQKYDNSPTRMVDCDPSTATAAAATISTAKCTTQEAATTAVVQCLHILLEGRDLNAVAGWFAATNPRVTLETLRHSSADDTDNETQESGAIWKTVVTSEIQTNLVHQVRWKELVVPLNQLFLDNNSSLQELKEEPFRIHLQHVDLDTQATVSMGHAATNIKNLLKMSGDPSNEFPLHQNDGTSYGTLWVRHARLQRPRRTTMVSCVKSRSSTRSKASRKRNSQVKATENVNPSLSSSFRKNHEACNPSFHQEKPIKRTSRVVANQKGIGGRRRCRSSWRSRSSGVIVSSAGDGDRGEEGCDVSEASQSLASHFSISNNLLYDRNSVLQLSLEGLEFIDVGGWFGQTNPYYQASVMTATGNNTWQQIYRSEAAMDTLSPIWKIATIPLALLVGELDSNENDKIRIEQGDFEKPVRFTFFSQNDGGSSPPTPIGFVDTNLLELKEAAQDTTKLLPIVSSEDADIDPTSSNATSRAYGNIRVLQAELPEELDLISLCSTSGSSNRSIIIDDIDVGFNDETCDGISIITYDFAESSMMQPGATKRHDKEAKFKNIEENEQEEEYLIRDSSCLDDKHATEQPQLTKDTTSSKLGKLSHDGDLNENTSVSAHLQRGENERLKRELREAQELIKKQATDLLLSKKSMSATQSECAKLNQIIADLKREGELQAEAALSVKDEITKQIEAENDDLKAKLKEMESAKSVFVNKSRELEIKLKDQEAENRSLMGLKDSLEMAKNIALSVRKQIPQLEREKEELTKKLEESLERVTTLEAHLSEKDSEAPQQKDTVGRLDIENDAVSKNNDVSEFQKLKASRTRILKKCKMLEKKVNSLKEEVTSARLAKGFYEKGWKDANHTIAELQGREEENGNRTVKAKQKSSKSTRKSTNPRRSTLMKEDPEKGCKLENPDTQGDSTKKTKAKRASSLGIKGTMTSDDRKPREPRASMRSSAVNSAKKVRRSTTSDKKRKNVTPLKSEDKNEGGTSAVDMDKNAGDKSPLKDRGKNNGDSIAVDPVVPDIDDDPSSDDDANPMKSVMVMFGALPNSEQFQAVAGKNGQEGDDNASLMGSVSNFFFGSG